MRREELPTPLKIDGHSLSWVDVVKEKVDKLWDRPLLQHYTNHGIDHSQRITKAMGKLLEGFPDLLNQQERFILLASIYLHDIGLQSPRYAGLPEKIGYTFEEMERVRKVHNESSAQMIKDSITPGSELPLGLENCREYVSYIADVSEYHRALDLTKLDNTSIGGEEVRLQLLAALLRLGDALDADYRRVNMNYLSLREVPRESKYHWWCHHYVQSVLIQRGHIKLYFRVPEKYKSDKVVDIIKEKVKESVSEAFLDVYDILDSYGIRLYRDIEIGSVKFLPEGSLQVIPDDLYEFIEVNVLKTLECSEKESARTGLMWFADGVPFSDDIDIVKCLGEAFSLVEKEKYLDAAQKLERCRILTMAPKDKMIFSIIAGNCYLTLGKLVEAERCFEDALNLSERQDLQQIYKRDTAQTKGAAMGNIGLVHKNKGDLDEALKYYKEALKIHEQIGYKQGEASGLGNIGLVHQDKGDLDEALKYYKEALKIHEQIGYKQGEATQLGNIGLIYSDKGDLDEALKCIEDALRIYREIGNKHGEASALGDIGTVYHAQSDLDEALRYFKRALNVHRGIGDRQGEATQLGNIGMVCREKGKLDEALKYHEDALGIDETIGYRLGEAIQLGNIGLVYAEKGDLDRALEYLENALKFYRDIGYKQGEARSLINIGILLNLSGKSIDALKYMRESLDIFEKIGMEKEADKVSIHILKICLRDNS